MRPRLQTLQEDEIEVICLRYNYSYNTIHFVIKYKINNISVCMDKFTNPFKYIACERSSKKELPKAL